MMIWLALLFFVSLITLTYYLLRVCEESSNADWGSRKVNRIVGFISLFCRYIHKFQFDPLLLPDEGGVLVASNHISGLDPFLLIAASPRPLRFLIAREQYERFGLNWLFRLGRCIPIDREGRSERALREALIALEQGDVVAVFPHGNIRPNSEFPRRLKGGVIFLAKKANCAIYPVRVADVRGAGFTALAVFIPGRPRLTAYPPLLCTEFEQGHCLTRLASILEPGPVAE